MNTVSVMVNLNPYLKDNLITPLDYTAIPGKALKKQTYFVCTKTPFKVIHSTTPHMRKQFHYNNLNTILNFPTFTSLI